MSGAEKVGIDDFLASATGGPEKALELLAKAKEARVREDKQSSILNQICENVELLHTEDLRPYAVVPVDGHRETWFARGQIFKHFIVSQYYRATNKPPSTEAVREAIALFCARAQFDGPVRAVGIRILLSGGNLCINLADDQWHTIEITGSVWRMVSDSVALFTRLPGMLPLPIPVEGVKIDELRDFLNVTDKEWVLIVAWLVGAFHPGGPYCILILQGEQGSGKSTVARVLRLLVDPAKPLLRTVPRDERDLIIAARNSWCIAIDNISGMQQWLSDALCRLSTGGGFGTRQLYTDDEEVLFDARRPILLNGIDEIVKSPDLADRAVIVTLPVLPEDRRKPEDAYWEEFERARPGILGALLKAVAAAHANIGGTKIKNPPRMADFTNWVCAAAPELPFTADEFLKTYRENRRDSMALSLEASPVASAVQDLVSLAPWEGGYTQLLKKLTERVSEAVQKSKAWPKNPRALSSHLRKVGPLLRDQKIEITELANDEKTNTKRIKIEKPRND
jgi:hypothetical protein